MKKRGNTFITVSYTHLDVYKRQVHAIREGFTGTRAEDEAAEMLNEADGWRIRGCGLRNCYLRPISLILQINFNII